MKSPIWKPSKKDIANANISKFTELISKKYSIKIENYSELYNWSIENTELFWTNIWEFFNVIGERGDVVLSKPTSMLNANWFPKAKINFAQNLLRFRDDREAIVFSNEKKQRQSLSYAELYNKTHSLQKYFKEIGLSKNDRVAAYLPNIPETVISMLATTSLGAVWSSCSPDFGIDGALERFKQVEPKVLIVCNGYTYKGKLIDCTQRVLEIAENLPSVEKVICVNYAQDCLENDFIDFDLLISEKDIKKANEIEFIQTSFNHPLYIMFSSGTTGKPKCIVHGVGGTLIEHLKELSLHCDIKKDDRVFQYTTCGWMMWNLYASSLALGSTLLLYDGAALFPKADILFDYLESEKATLFGTSAKYISAIENSGLSPIKSHNLESLRTITSTGSPLVPENYEYVYTKIKKDICLQSISGGTDIIGCFALGNPTLPVYSGELQCRSLGLKVEVFNSEAKTVIEQKGELVCTAPFPSQPIYFLNDPDNQKYYNSYFSYFKGKDIWRHGDWVELTKNEGLIIYGRSDTTLNPGGVRIGTAEIYRQVEKFVEVSESLVVGQSFNKDQRIILFVVLNDGYELDSGLKLKLKNEIKINCTARHVPAKIIQAPELPRTVSGKIAELAVKKAIHAELVENTSAFANPDSIEFFKNLNLVSDG